MCLTESSLAKAATSEQLAMDKYKEGTISIVEVLNAQMYHQEAELNHIRSKLRAQLARAVWNGLPAVWASTDVKGL